jgi:hypothetical protein
MAGLLHALAIVAATGLGSAAAAADVSRTGLPVSATVLPACTVSTAPNAAANISCSHLGGGSFAIERSDAADPMPQRRDPVIPAAETSAKPGVTYLTVTY